MANFNITPNMSLPNPVPGVDPGPDYATNLQSSLNIIDQHDHTAGNGVQIPPAGININSDLSFNSNNAISLRSVRFAKQASVSLASDLNCLYVLNDGNLYFNDGAGDSPIQITSGGAVNATSSGITSGTATAAFVSSVLVVNAASTKPADIKGGSLFLGNNTAGSHYLKLTPPNAMGADYTLSLPTIPASQSFVTVDTSGNIAPYASISGGIQRSNLVPVGQVMSPSCGTFLTSSTTPVLVTNLSLTLPTTGRPVMVFVQSDGSSTGAGFGVSSNGPSAVGNVEIYRGTTLISSQGVLVQAGNGTTVVSSSVPVGSIMCMDIPPAGNQTYLVKIYLQSPAVFVFLDNAVLVAYELK